jgi:hypothetical protein
MTLAISPVGGVFINQAKNQISMETTDRGRGPVILVLGILSLIMCAPLGPIAWVMGSGDLRRIDSGQISEEARGLTQAGMICGIIGTVILCVSIVVVLVVLVTSAIGFRA